MAKQNIEVYLSRLGRYFKNLDRIGKMWYILAGFSLILITVLFSFTILNHDFYKNLADYYQKTTTPDSRGTISSSTASLHGTVAVSTDLGTLAIDPVQTGSTTKLLDLLGTAVVTQFCSQETRANCIENIASYTRNEELKMTQNLTDEELKKRIAEYIK